MDASTIETPAELIMLDQELIERQPPQTRHLWMVVMAFVQQLLGSIAELRQTIASRDQTILTLRAEIQKPKQARKTPRNSSVPPSTEHPHAKPKSSRLPTGKARGGQPGHPKHARELLPIEQCDEVIELVPEVCRRCGEPLDQHQCQFDPLRHQVWEIPLNKPIVIEYSRKPLLCEKCKETTTGSLPADVPTSTAGPKLLATTAMLLSRLRGSRRLTAEALSSFFGIPASASWVVKLQTEITSLLRPIYDELVATLPRLLWVNADETPYKEGDLKSWLWAVRSKHFTVFAICPDRKADHIQSLLGADFTGIVMCDRAKMYLGFETIQWCWAHLRRDFVALSDTHPSINSIGQELVDLTDELFHYWQLFRGGTLTRAGLQESIAELRVRMEDALDRGTRSEHSFIAGRCRSILTRPEALWVFASTEGVEPTNNAAERAIRPLVILRKLSYGTQSAAGSRFVETVQTMLETCRQQGRNAFEFITDAITKARRQEPLPSLLPDL